VHGLILAGGEGSRLAADGVAEPKAAVSVAGRSQILRLAETFDAIGCRDITCMVRSTFPDVIASVRTIALSIGRPRVIACETPSSLHTLAEALLRMPAGPVFCSMVDTVMPARDWQRVYDESLRHIADGADAVLAVTPHVDDERPLWVERAPGGDAIRIGSRPVMPPCVTGGVYAFGPRARATAVRVWRDGGSRMRYFLSALVDEGARVATTEVALIVDLDHKRDIEAADALLATEASAS
jgi:GTP:adenosylcobinamide-phosphate guanylyltransferase